ncbi:MAG: hypothetical protein ACTSPY_17750 [Candidatus Helarchaeota archaeon]
MNYLRLLNVINIFGGLYEILFGFLLIFFIEPLIGFLGVANPTINFPIFNQTAGLLAVFIGILLILSSLDLKHYLLIPIIITFLRFSIQIVIFSNIFIYPEMTIGLIIFASVDLILGIITIILIKKCGFSFKAIFKSKYSNS